MELGLTAPVHGHLTRRGAPIAAGAALAAGAGFIAMHNPAASSFPYPTCAFYQATGLWCPGCGLTRGTYQLLHGHLGAALSYNIFTPVALVAILVVWSNWVRVSWGGTSLRLPPRAIRWLAIATPALVLLYGVLRNVPVTPLRALAP